MKQEILPKLFYLNLMLKIKGSVYQGELKQMTHSYESKIMCHLEEYLFSSVSLVKSIVLVPFHEINIIIWCLI